VRLLAIDTSSAQCSAALLLEDGGIEHRDVLTARDHAKLLLPLVDELLAGAGWSLRSLDGIAFGRGPGSFTGVRIAAAVTQGLAAGAGLPVLPVSSLRALAEQARCAVQAAEGAVPDGALLACMDARMGEVYWSVFDGGLAAAREAVGAPHSVHSPAAQVVAAAGRGLAAFPQIAVSLQLSPGRLFAAAEPHAREVAALAVRDLREGAQWLDPGLAQPVYLRDEVVRTAEALSLPGAVKSP
jgi:tRNA threonylcarbamoyladenosine biosynthesis protein TsaB